MLARQFWLRAGCRSFRRMSTSPIDQQQRLALRIGGRVYVNPKKFELGLDGEDSFFTHEPQNGDNVTHQSFGVADGVGDWVFIRGIDSAQYSRQLMAQSKKIFQQNPESAPSDVLRQSYDKIQELDTAGSSTICLANFSCETARLSVANLVRMRHCLLACRHK